MTCKVFTALNVKFCAYLLVFRVCICAVKVACMCDLNLFLSFHG